MKALVYEGPERLAWREAEAPAAASGECLVRVEAVGVCGSDLHAWLGRDERRPAPLILGHEAAGTVVEGPLAGKRVAVNPLVSCGACEACAAGRENLCPDRQVASLPPREGAFAELLRSPAGNLVEIGPDLSAGKAALAEPLAVCLHAVRLSQRLLARPLGAARCLVIGGGAIGLGTALWLRASGAAEVAVSEANPLRRGPLAALVDGPVLEPAALSGAFDLVVDAAGFRGTRETAGARARPGGVVCHAGLGDSDGGLDIRRATLQEIVFAGTYAYTAAEFRETVAAIAEGRLGPLDWTEARGLSEGAEAFRDLHEGKVEAPKIVLHP